jgi:PAS domain S-box-containing protein
MMCLDIFLQTVDAGAWRKINRQLKKPMPIIHPLWCWDIVLMQRCKKEKKLIAKHSDLDILKTMKHQNKWNINVDEILAPHYDALVITDSKKIIQWVNDGFYPMTGYLAEEAIGQSPKFLQGERTTPQALEKLKKGFLSAKPFSVNVINYKKDRSTYACNLTIFPLRNNDDFIVNYLALEVEYVMQKSDLP